MIFTIIISIIYTTLISAFTIGFNKVELVKNKNAAPKHTFSIIIPFRNEANNIPRLLKSISLLNYPKNIFEIILVNDDSTDDFNSIINAFIKKHPNINLLFLENDRKTNSPKKDAINTAIEFSSYNWILTTDADCAVPKNWLSLFNQFIEEKKPLFISAPVKFSYRNDFLFHFQNLNFISLIGSTIGSFGLKKPIMCNGANLCYHKNTFIQLNGFEGNTTIASGDDIFLLEKFYKSFPEKVKFLNSFESIVETNSEKNWELFLNQQLRWASKSTAYKGTFSKFVGILVFMVSLTLVVLAILSILNTNYLKLFLILLIPKIIIDFILIFKTSSSLKSTKTFTNYLSISLLYSFFIVSIAFFSFFKNYQWKGRTFKK